MKKWIPISAYMKLKKMNYQQFNSFMGSCIEKVFREREGDSLNEIQVKQALSKDFNEEDVNKILELLNIKLYETDKYSYICGECGKELHGKYSFCPHCGARLEWEE